jgi:hypothetical protein
MGSAPSGFEPAGLQPLQVRKRYVILDAVLVPEIWTGSPRIWAPPCGDETVIVTAAALPPGNAVTGSMARLKARRHDRAGSRKEAGLMFRFCDQFVPFLLRICRYFPNNY